jgi:hypothetical protein
VSEASNLTKGPLGPGRGTPETAALVGPDGKVVVVEGMHRLEAAKRGTVIPPDKSSVPGRSDWLEYDLFEPK